MATGFKDEEIEAAVSRYVQSGLRVDRSPLGPTDADSKFSEVLALISSTLIFDPNAIFYLIYLASNRLNSDALTAIGHLDNLIQAISEMGKRTQDVTRTTLLGDAAAALLTVDQILTNKNTISSQAYSRYQTSVVQFIDTSLKQNIKSGTSIVRSPQEAKAAAKTILASLSPAYVALLAGTSQLQGELSDFLGLDLSVFAIQDSVRKVRYDLQALQTNFEAAENTKDDRIALCRTAYLSLVSGKAVLDNYTTVTDPSAPRLASATSTVGRAAMPTDDGAFTPAQVVGTLSAPWPLVAGVSDTLSIAEDGHSPTIYTIPSPTQPSVRCYIPESYTIVVGVNDLLELDELPAHVTLTPGVGMTALQVVTDINTWAAANYPGIYSASVVTVLGMNYVQITKIQAGSQKITLTAENGPAAVVRSTYETLGFYEGQSDSSVGVSGDELIDAINVVGKIRASLDRTFFEEGRTGTLVDLYTIDLPLNSLGSLLHTGDQLIIRDGANAGYHQIVSVMRAASDRVAVSSSTPFKYSADSQSWQIYRETLRLESLSTGLSTRLVIGSGTANALIGLTTSTVNGMTTGFRAATSGTDLDFSRRSIVVGDIVYVTAGSETSHTVSALSSDAKQLELSPALSVGSTITAFRVLSAAAVAHSSFQGALTAWKGRVEQSSFDSDILELERAMNPLIANPHPSLAQMTDAMRRAQELRDLLTDSSPSGLSEILVAFVVASVGRIDAALKMLKERGMDRAYDQLMQGQIAALFSMDKDDAASSAFMLKSMRGIVQSDLPVSKLDDDVDDTSVFTTATGTDANQDYADADRDENLRVLGDVPDFDNPADETATSQKRY